MDERNCQQQSCKDSLLLRLDSTIAHHRGEIALLETVKEFVATQDTEKLQGDLGTIISRGLSWMHSMGE